MPQTNIAQHQDYIKNIGVSVIWIQIYKSKSLNFELHPQGNLLHRKSHFILTSDTPNSPPSPTVLLRGKEVITNEKEVTFCNICSQNALYLV